MRNDVVIMTIEIENNNNLKLEMSKNALEHIFITNKELKKSFQNNYEYKPDQLARSIVIMATQIIIITMFLSVEALSVFTDNLLKSKHNYEINLKLFIHKLFATLSHRFATIRL
jgi:high-affinity K+ transport system ATPase subunit B